MTISGQPPRGSMAHLLLSCLLALLLYLPAAAKAAVTVSDANRSVVKLRAGGASATVLLEGRGLDQLRSARVSGQPSIKVTLGGKLGGDMRVLTLKAAAGTRQGRYPIELISSSRGSLAVARSIVEVQVGQLLTVDQTPAELRELPDLPARQSPPVVKNRGVQDRVARDADQPQRISPAAKRVVPKAGAANTPPHESFAQRQTNISAKTEADSLRARVVKVPGPGQGIVSSEDAVLLSGDGVPVINEVTGAGRQNPLAIAVPPLAAVPQDSPSPRSVNRRETAEPAVPPAYRDPIPPPVLPAPTVDLGEGNVVSVTAGDYGIASERLDYQQATSALEPKSTALLVLEGVVRDADTGEPIGNAKVQLGDLRTTSRSDGSYRIEVDPSKSGINAGARGYRGRELEPWQRPQTMVLRQDIRLASVNSAAVEDQPQVPAQRSNLPTSRSGPDLVFPAKPSLPACKGAEVTVRLPIENRGRAAAQGYQITLSAQRLGVGRFDRRIDSVIVGGPVLEPGASAVVDVELRFNGTEELIELTAIADSGQVLREQDESNNLLFSGQLDMRYVPSCSGVASRKPDLAMMQRLGFAQQSGANGCEVAIEAVVQNLNNRNAAPSSVEVQIADPRHSKAWRKSINVPMIPGGDEQAVLIRAPMDAVLAATGLSGRAGVGGSDTLTVSVTADVEQRVNEAFETNNGVLVERTLAELMGEKNLRYRRAGEPCWDQ